MAKKKSHKTPLFKLTLAIITLIILAVAFVIYLQKYNLNPNSTDVSNTESWNIYQTPVIDGLGYKLKYPKDWKLESGVGGKDNSQPKELSISIKGPKCKTGGQDFFNLKHYMSNNPKLEFERIMSLAEFKDPSKNAKIKQISYLKTQNNREIVKIKTYIIQYSPSFTSYFQTKKGVYHIVGSGSRCSTDFEKNYDEVIKSLEFTN